MTPIERAARALYDGGLDIRSPTTTLGDPLTWGELTVIRKAPYFDGARALLRAIREPSEHMVEMGGKKVFPGSRSAAEGDIARAWRSMIDAALEEGPTSGM